MPKHPFLDLDNLPAWSELSPDLIKSEISNALERSEERLQNIRSLSPQESNFNNSVKALEQATIYLDHAWGLVGIWTPYATRLNCEPLTTRCYLRFLHLAPKFPWMKNYGRSFVAFQKNQKSKIFLQLITGFWTKLLQISRSPVLIYLRKKKTVSKKYHPNLPKLPSNFLNGFSMPQIHGN